MSEEMINWINQLALQKAAQAWCESETENKVMDTELATAFANILYKYISAINTLVKEWPRGVTSEYLNKLTKDLLT